MVTLFKGSKSPAHIKCVKDFWSAKLTVVDCLHGYVCGNDFRFAAVANEQAGITQLIDNAGGCQRRSGLLPRQLHGKGSGYILRLLTFHGCRSVLPLWTSPPGYSS